MRTLLERREVWPKHEARAIWDEEDQSKVNVRSGKKQVCFIPNLHFIANAITIFSSGGYLGPN